MRVLHSIPSIDPSYGGPVFAARGLSRGLMKEGISLAILTSSSGSKEIDKKNKSSFERGIDFIWFNPFVRRFYWDPFLASKIKNKIRDYDLWHIHGVFNGLAHALCGVARTYKIPYMLEPFGTLSPYCLRKSALLKKLDLILGEKKNIEGAAAVRFTSEKEEKQARIHFHIGRSFVAPLGLDLLEFALLPPRGLFRKEFGIKEKEGMILFLGRLQPIKGLEVFLPAFLRWGASQAKKWRFVIVGPDEAGYRKKLEALVSKMDARDSIVFAGALYGEDRIRAYVDSDFLTLPSFHENFGLSAAEVMACGKPVIVSDEVGLSQAVKDFGIGEVAELNLNSMIQALDRMILRESEWPAMGERAKEWVRKNYDQDVISKNILNEYRQIVEHHGRRK